MILAMQDQLPLKFHIYERKISSFITGMRLNSKNMQAYTVIGLEGWHRGLALRNIAAGSNRLRWLRL